MTGVLEQERQRRQAWDDLGLPDPVGLVSMERLVRVAYGIEGWRHAGRAAIDNFIAEHGRAALPAPLPSRW